MPRLWMACARRAPLRCVADETRHSRQPTHRGRNTCGRKRSDHGHDEDYSADITIGHHAIDNQQQQPPLSSVRTSSTEMSKVRAMTTNRNLIQDFVPLSRTSRTEMSKVSVVSPRTRSAGVRCRSRWNQESSSAPTRAPPSRPWAGPEGGHARDGQL
jgi:hypothetical protein